GGASADSNRARGTGGEGRPGGVSYGAVSAVLDDRRPAGVRERGSCAVAARTRARAGVGADGDGCGGSGSTGGSAAGVLFGGSGVSGRSTVPRVTLASWTTLTTSGR